MCKQIEKQDNLFKKIKKHQSDISLNSCFNQFKCKFKGNIQDAKSSYYKNNFHKCNCNQKQQWKITNEITEQKGNDFGDIKLMKDDCSIVIDQLEVTNMFNSCFLKSVHFL